MRKPKSQPKPPRPKKVGGAANRLEYVLCLSERQLEVLEKALDLYSRVGMGQIKEAVRVMCQGRPHVEAGHTASNIYTFESALRGVEPVHGIQSITSPEIDDEFRVAHDIQQVARYGLHASRFHRDPEYRQKSHAYVYGDPPRRYSAYEPELPVLFRRPIERR